MPQLSRLEHVIALCTSMAENDPNGLSDINVDAWTHSLQEECGKIKGAIICTGLGMTGTGSIELAVQQWQAAITHYANQLFTLKAGKLCRQKNADQAVEKVSTNKSIVLTGPLLDLLTFLQNRFPKYFNTDATIPSALKHKAALLVKNQKQVIRKGLSALGIPAELIALSMLPFKQFTSEGEPSFHSITYLQQFEAALWEFIDLNITEDASNRLYCLLTSLNLNTAAFYDHYIHALKAKVERLEDVHQLAGFYSHELKVLNQVPERNIHPFDPYSCSIKYQLSCWIMEELNYLEKRSRPAVIPGRESSAESSPVTKVQTSLSVAQLSFGIKLLIDAGVISHDNSSGLMKLVSRHFRTANMEDISVRSLLKKHYTHEAGTVKKVKDVVIELLNQVKRY